MTEKERELLLRSSGAASTLVPKDHPTRKRMKQLADEIEAEAREADENGECPNCANPPHEGECRRKKGADLAAKAREIAERLVDWMSDQQYQGESLLHAIICCDHASRQHFVDAVAVRILAALRDVAEANAERLRLLNNRFRQQEFRDAKTERIWNEAADLIVEEMQAILRAHGLEGK